LNSPDDVDTDSLKNEYLKLKDENERLKKRIEELTKEVSDRNKNKILVGAAKK
jgi:hypothetical protein